MVSNLVPKDSGKLMEESNSRNESNSGFDLHLRRFITSELGDKKVSTSSIDAFYILSK
jgi:hypothetical protein